MVRIGTVKTSHCPSGLFSYPALTSYGNTHQSLHCLVPQRQGRSRAACSARSLCQDSDQMQEHRHVHWDPASLGAERFKYANGRRLFWSFRSRPLRLADQQEPETGYFADCATPVTVRPINAWVVRDVRCAQSNCMEAKRHSKDWRPDAPFATCTFPVGLDGQRLTRQSVRAGHSSLRRAARHTRRNGLCFLDCRSDGANHLTWSATSGSGEKAQALR